ncbi:MAG: hypothetical protein ACTS3F_04550 [Phycisphaerales bacterium]
MYLYFRPDVFFRHFIRNHYAAITFLCCWVLGMAHVWDRLMQRAMTGRLDEEIGGSWGVVWLLIGLVGLLGGALRYFIGGWWYRVRLGWCGHKGSDPKIARRVYIYASMIVGLPAFALLLNGWVSQPTPAAAAVHESWLDVLMVLFPFWSVVASFVGVRTVFKVRTGPAVVWFLVLPMLVYSLAIVALALLLVFGGE